MANALQVLQADKPARPQSALKLVKTNNMDRDQWLTVRKQGIGSSDAAAAVGLNPYCSQLDSDKFSQLSHAAIRSPS